MFLLTGCSMNLGNWFSNLFGFETESGEMGEQELLWNAMDLYEAGDYKKALEQFEQFKDWYPFSDYAILADLKSADCNYYLGNYGDAFFGYEEFENLHPLNEATPYVVYQSGMCKFLQMDTIDRDTRNAKQAVEIFRKVQEQYPSSVYAQKSTDKIKQALKLLAGHELYVAYFYYRGGHYKAALGRYESIITRYPDVGIHQQAMEYIAICEQYIKQEEALEQAVLGVPVPPEVDEQAEAGDEGAATTENEEKPETDEIEETELEDKTDTSEE